LFICLQFYINSVILSIYFKFLLKYL
jgi:hypothetical protein